MNKQLTCAVPLGQYRREETPNGLLASLTLANFERLTGQRRKEGNLNRNGTRTIIDGPSSEFYPIRYVLKTGTNADLHLICCGATNLAAGSRVIGRRNRDEREPRETIEEEPLSPDDLAEQETEADAGVLVTHRMVYS